MGMLNDFWGTSNTTAQQVWLTLIALLILILLKLFSSLLIGQKISNDRQRYHVRKVVTYIHTTLMIIILGSIWFRGIASLGTFLGLASAGLAVALHEPISNIAGFFLIESRKPFQVGDRIELNGVKGDVIDVRLFEFSVVEVGNWVDADQSTGRIIHIPNSLVLKAPLSNYNIGFEYIWNEIPVLITFESDWKRAKEILTNIAKTHAEQLTAGAEEQIRRAARRYLIVAGTLTPTVYTTVKDSGVMLTIRYIVNPRQRRDTEQDIWEEILESFAEQSNIELAYQTTRFFSSEPPPERNGN